MNCGEKSSERFPVREDRFGKILHSSSFFDIKNCIPFVKTGPISTFLTIQHLFFSSRTLPLHSCISDSKQITTHKTSPIIRKFPLLTKHAKNPETATTILSAAVLLLTAQEKMAVIFANNAGEKRKTHQEKYTRVLAPPCRGAAFYFVLYLCLKIETLTTARRMRHRP